MNAEEAKALLKEIGISVMNRHHGYMVTVSKRQICTCGNCIEARLNKTLSACEINELMHEIYDSVIPPNPSNFIPELSPTYWKNVKSIRMSRPAF